MKAEPLPEISQQYLFGPVGMTNTSWAAGVTPANVATRYIVDEDELIAIPDYHAVTYPDGGAVSSASDMGRYMAAIMNGGILEGKRVLSNEGIQAMLSNQTDVPVPERGIGYFWRLDGDYFSHSAADPGVRTQIWADRKNSIAVVVLTNGDLNHDATSESFNGIYRLSQYFARSM